MENYFAISIGRQLGSGGREIGEKIAKMLNVSCFDKDLINMASKESGIATEFFEQADEKVNHGIWGQVYGIHGMAGQEMFFGNYLSNEALFGIQSEVVRDLAQKQSAVFVGRCADYVLRDHQRSLHIFISADMDDRVQRIVTKHDLSEKKAVELIEKTDKKRAAYYNYFSNKTWGQASSYHLCINSSVLGVDQTIGFLYQFILQKFSL